MSKGSNPDLIVCQECERTCTRRNAQGALVKGYPTYGGRGLCSSCYQRARRKSPRPRHHWDGETPCLDCGRRMRTKNQPELIGRRPLYSQQGRCVSCISRRRRANGGTAPDSPYPQRPPTALELYQSGSKAVSAPFRPPTKGKLRYRRAA